MNEDLEAKLIKLGQDIGSNEGCTTCDPTSLIPGDHEISTTMAALNRYSSKIGENVGEAIARRELEPVTARLKAVRAVLQAALLNEDDYQQGSTHALINAALELMN